MEVGRFEMAYTVLLPCLFTIYLNPEEHAVLRGVFPLIAEDARRALRARVTELSKPMAMPGLRRRDRPVKEYKIACRDWEIEFLPDPEVPPGDVEIHSELSESVQPGFRGTKTTLLEREPTAGSSHASSQRPSRAARNEAAFAEIHYQDESGPQTFRLSQNLVRIGRGGDGQPVELILYTSDEVSREHAAIRRDPATGDLFLADSSTNGTWVNGKKVPKGAEVRLSSRAEIALGEVITLTFEVHL